MCVCVCGLFFFFFGGEGGRWEGGKLFQVAVKKEEFVLTWGFLEVEKEVVLV